MKKRPIIKSLYYKTLLCHFRLYSRHGLITSLLITLFLINQPLRASDQLTIYTYDSFISQWGPGNKLKSLFEQNCNCSIRFVSSEDGVSILNRLRIEGENTKADIILGIDNLLILDSLKTGLIAKHKVDLSNLSDGLAETFSKAHIDAQNTAKDDKNTYFVPFDFGYFSFIYDSDNISQPAQSLSELLSQDVKVIYQDPRTSTVGQGLLLWMNQVFKKDTQKAWEKLSARTVTVTKGWSQAYSIFLEGGADYVLSYHTSPAYHIENDNTTRYKAAKFNEGHIRQIEVAAVLKTSQQKDLANAFLAFLITPQSQRIIATHNWMQPVIDGVSLPTGFDNLIEPKTIHWSQQQFANKRQEWLRNWRNAAAGNP